MPENRRKRPPVRVAAVAEVSRCSCDTSAWRSLQGHEAGAEPLMGTDACNSGFGRVRDSGPPRGAASGGKGKQGGRGGWASAGHAEIRCAPDLPRQPLHALHLLLQPAGVLQRKAAGQRGHVVLAGSDTGAGTGHTFCWRPPARRNSLACSAACRVSERHHAAHGPAQTAGPNRKH